MPLLSSSVGRVYLAHLPAAMTDPVLLSQANAAEQAELTPAEIETVKADARRDGFVVTSDGVLSGVTSVAAPVFTPGGALPLVVSLAVPTRHATKGNVDGLAQEVRATAAAMSAEIGHRQPEPPTATGAHPRK
jgi:DNA-binding IclR family transcriptional regulator